LPENLLLLFSHFIVLLEAASLELLGSGCEELLEDVAI
jgi:hypothetical protein